VLAPNVGLGIELGLYNGKRLVQTVVLLVGGGVLLAYHAVRKQWVASFCAIPWRARWGLAAVTGMGSVSALQAPATGNALLEVGHIMLLFVLAGLVATAYRQQPVWAERVLLGSIVACVGLYAVQFAVGYGMHLGLDGIKLWPEGDIGFNNIRHFNQLQTWTLPLLAVPVLALPRSWSAARGAVPGLLALWWALVIASDVRGTVLAMLGAVICVVVLFRSGARSWLKVQAAGLLAGGALYAVLFVMLGDAPEVVGRLADAGEYGGRIESWAEALQLWASQPWLGVGPMHFSWAPHQFTRGAHPHNALLQWLAEWGLPSTVIMVTLTCWGAGRWMGWERSAQPHDTGRGDTALRVGLVASALAGGAHAMVSGIIVMPVSQMLLVLVGGWAWGRYLQAHPPTPVRDAGRAQLVIAVVLVASMGIVAWGAQGAFTAKERRATYLEAVERSRLHPRYWQQGYFGIDALKVEPRAARGK